MLYKLICPACTKESRVDSDITVSGWICGNCGNENISSLPTDGMGKLVNNPNVVVDPVYVRPLRPAKGIVVSIKPEVMPSILAAEAAAAAEAEKDLIGIDRIDLGVSAKASVDG